MNQPLAPPIGTYHSKPIGYKYLCVTSIVIWNSISSFYHFLIPRY